MEKEHILDFIEELLSGAINRIFDKIIYDSLAGKETAAEVIYRIKHDKATCKKYAAYFQQ